MACHPTLSLTLPLLLTIPRVLTPRSMNPEVLTRVDAVNSSRLLTALNRTLFALNRTLFALNRTLFALDRTLFALNRTLFALDRTLFALDRTGPHSVRRWKGAELRAISIEQECNR